MPKELLPAIWSAESEVHISPRYRIDNARQAGNWWGTACAIQRTLSGAGFWEQDGKRRLVTAGEAFLVSHQESSSYGYPPEAREPYQLQHITFELGSLQSLFQTVRQEFGSVVHMTPAGEAAVLFEDIVSRYQKGRFRDALQAADALFRLVLAIFREQLDSRHAKDPIALGHELLSGNVGTRLGLKDIARRIGVSREHFCREYLRRYGVSPGTALRQLRMARAHAMLRSTSLAIEDVAAACGFSSGNSFQQAYLSHFGENPSKSRARS